MPITAFQMKLLVDNPWNGGAGYSYKEIGEMTLDQVYHRLCDIEILKKDAGGLTESLEPMQAIAKLKPDENGFIKGRDENGNLIKKKFSGKSLARQLMEQKEAREREERMAKRKRRKKRGS